MFSLVLGEPPLPSPYGRAVTRPKNAPELDGSRIVDQRLLDRVAAILSQDGDGDGFRGHEEPQEREGYNIVNSDFLQRIARIISQNEGQTSPSAPHPQGPAITQEYGVPSEVGQKLVGANFEIGQPFPARRIASFDLTDDDGGYSSNSNGGYRGNGVSRIMFISSPQVAERIAAFEIPEQQTPQVRSSY